MSLVRVFAVAVLYGLTSVRFGGLTAEYVDLRSVDASGEPRVGQAVVARYPCSLAEHSVPTNRRAPAQRRRAC
jgi:hypothetical protein